MIRNNIKISTFAVACVLCAGSFSVHAASSIRTFGGAGTYTSASNAESAKSSDSINSVRAGYVSRTLANSTKSASTSDDDSSATASSSTARLSIGKYLSTGNSVKSGGKLVSQNPSVGDSSQTAEIQQQIDTLQTVVDALEAGKQDTLAAGNGIDITNGVISTTISGREVQLQSVAGLIQWKYNDETVWNDLVSIQDIIDTNLANYSTTTDMNNAIATAVSNVDVSAKEDIANKSTDISADTGSTDKYPSVSAVENYVGTAVSGVDVSAKEDIANKSTSIPTDTGSDSKYPTVKAVEDYRIYGAPSDASDYVSVVNNGVVSWKKVAY